MIKRIGTLSVALLVIAGGAIAFTSFSATAVLGDDPGRQIDSTVKRTVDRLPIHVAHADEDDLQPRQLEREVHDEINRVRHERGLSNLSYDAQLAEIARYHSRDMTERDYGGHTAPDGETVADRYAKFDYECRVPVGDDRFVSSGENVAITGYGVDVRTKTGTVHYDTSEELAKGIVDQWMHSPGHRKTLLRPYWRSGGIGVAIEERNDGLRVYVTQNFC